jgi:hypothetical protein
MWPNRILSAGLVSLFVTALHLAEPSPVAREKWLYLLALPVGYGHLLGGLVFARRRLRAACGSAPPLLAGLFASSLLLTLLALYTRALQEAWLGLAVVVGLLAYSAWHILENDLALSAAYRAGMKLERSRLSAGVRLRIGCAMAGLFLLASSTPEGHAALRDFSVTPLPVSAVTMADLTTWVLLYHASTWATFFAQRARVATPGEARRVRRGLLWVHALPLAVNTVCYLWFESLWVHLSMPTIYLFWSAAHAAQTSLVRAGAPGAPGVAVAS